MDYHHYICAKFIPDIDRSEGWNQSLHTLLRPKEVRLCHTQSCRAKARKNLLIWCLQQSFHHILCLWQSLLQIGLNTISCLGSEEELARGVWKPDDRGQDLHATAATEDLNKQTLRLFFSLTFVSNSSVSVAKNLWFCSKRIRSVKYSEH